MARPLTRPGAWCPPSPTAGRQDSIHDASHTGGFHDLEDADSASGSDEDAFEQDALSEWTLRKCSAAALDTLAVRFPDRILPILLPLLDEQLRCNEWMRLECVILALGAVAAGCMNEMVPRLPEVVPFLAQCLEHEQVRVLLLLLPRLARCGWTSPAGACL